MKRSQVVCKEREAGIVEDLYCNKTSKPDDKVKSCNEHLCPARSVLFRLSYKKQAFLPDSVSMIKVKS